MKTFLSAVVLFVVVNSTALVAHAADSNTKSDAKADATTNAKAGGVTPYPLKVCIVTDNDLGSMGDEKVIVHEGREIKFCCAPCERKFLKNPAKYVAKLTPAEPGKEPTKASPEAHDSAKTAP